ncbi:PAS domain-containing protein [Niabella sp. W65]|nr:PAS domain-containing protein [Niabella sp. W65]MCH7364187.1 PAS domain-containing protein [Niabella sp. W65]ULT40060.1 PAS domain-containing protein [Niabella sp. I65]
MQNLINSTDIGTIFLDRGFRVALFTPAARNIFNLILSDYGRPITDITSRLTYDDLLKDAEAVLDKLTMVEKEVTTVDNQVYLMRLFPTVLPMIVSTVSLLLSLISVPAKSPRRS